jgi:hypothetical protein
VPRRRTYPRKAGQPVLRGRAATSGFPVEIPSGHVKQTTNHITRNQIMKKRIKKKIEKRKRLADFEKRHWISIKILGKSAKKLIKETTQPRILVELFGW